MRGRTQVECHVLNLVEQQEYALARQSVGEGLEIAFEVTSRRTFVIRNRQGPDLRAVASLQSQRSRKFAHGTLKQVPPPKLVDPRTAYIDVDGARDLAGFHTAAQGVEDRRFADTSEAKQSGVLPTTESIEEFSHYVTAPEERSIGTQGRLKREQIATEELVDKDATEAVRIMDV